MKRAEGLPGCFFAALAGAVVLGYIVGDIATLVGAGLCCVLGLAVMSLARENFDAARRGAAIAEVRAMHLKHGPSLPVVAKLFGAIFPEARGVTLHELEDEPKVIAIVELTRWQRWRWRRSLWRQQKLATELVAIKPAHVVVEVQIKVTT